MPSMRSAINAKCKDCIYDPEESGTWREQVSGCTSADCALWDLRPRPAPPKKAKSGHPTDAEATREGGR